VLTTIVQSAAVFLFGLRGNLCAEDDVHNYVTTCAQRTMFTTTWPLLSLGNRGSLRCARCWSVSWSSHWSFYWLLMMPVLVLVLVSVLVPVLVVGQRRVLWCWCGWAS